MSTAKSVTAARLFAAARPAKQAAIQNRHKPISIPLKRYTNLLLPILHTNQATNERNRPADMDKLYTLLSRLIDRPADWMAGPSVKVARSAITQRQKANRRYSKNTRPLLFGTFELTAASVISGGGLKNGDNSQYHNRLSKD